MTLQYDISKVSTKTKTKKKCAPLYHCEVELCNNDLPVIHNAQTESDHNMFISKVLLDRATALLGNYTKTNGEFTRLPPPSMKLL
jgi:hypothetical protein